MNRKGEMILGIIGIVFSVFMALIGMILTWASNSAEAKSLLTEIAESDPTFAQENIDIDLIFTSIAGAGIVTIIGAVIGLIVGIVAVICIKGNKKPKLAGILFIAGAVLMGIISIVTGFLPALLYLIAGIMCLVRKPQTIEQ